MEDLIFKRKAENIKRGKVTAISTLLIGGFMVGVGLFIQSNLLMIISIWTAVVGLYLMMKSSSNIPSALVNEDGLTISLNGMGLIPWGFVLDFEVKSINNAHFFIIRLKDFEQYVKDKGKVSMFFLSANIDKVACAIVLPESEFNDSLEEVKGKIEAYKSNL